MIKGFQFDAYIKHMVIWGAFNLQMNVLKLEAELQAQEQIRENEKRTADLQRQEYEFQVSLFNNRILSP